MAVAVEVPCDHGIGTGAGGIERLRGCKGAVAITGKRTHRPGIVDHGNVRAAIAVKIADGHGRGTIAHGIVAGGAEGAVPFA